MGEIKQLKNKDKTKDILPITNTKAVYDDEGNKLSDTLSGLTDSGNIQSFSVGEDGSPYITYKVGADSVTKKLDSDSKHGFANYSTTNHLVVECGFKPTSVMVVSTDNYRRHLAYTNTDKNLNYYAADNAGASLASESKVYINTTDTGFVAIFGGTRAVSDGQEFEWFACK